MLQVARYVYLLEKTWSFRNIIDLLAFPWKKIKKKSLVSRGGQIAPAADQVLCQKWRDLMNRVAPSREIDGGHKVSYLILSLSLTTYATMQN